MTIVNSGTIAGGVSGDTTPVQANAISFTGGTNSLTTNTGATYTGAFAIATGATLTLLQTTAANATGSATYATTGQFTGAGALNVTTANGYTVTISGANTGFTGTTTVTSGSTLVIGNANAIGGGTLYLTGGASAATAATLDFTGSLTFANAIVGTGDPVYNVPTGSTVVVSGQISGTGDLTVNSGGAGDTGTLTLTNATNNFTGATVIDAGTLAPSGTGTVATSSGVSLATGATFDISQTTAGASIATLGNTATGQTGTVSLGAQTLTITNGSSTFAGVIQDGGIGAGTGGALALTGGTETLTGTNTYTGGTTLTGGTLVVGNDSALGTGKVAFGGGRLQFGGSYTIANNATVDANGGTIDAVSTSTYSGNIVDATTTTGGTLTFTSSTGSAIILTGTNTYSGPTDVANGVTLAAGSTTALSPNSAFTVNGILSLSGHSNTIESLAGTGNVTNNNATAATLTLAATTGSTTFGGTLVDGAGGGALSLAKTDGSTQVLSGANTYTGATTITAGTLALTGAGSIATSSGVVDNGTFDISAGGASASIKSLSGAGVVTLGPNTLNITAASATPGASFSGAIGGAGGVTLSGGTEGFSGTNGYSGTTTVTGGTLEINGSILNSNKINIGPAGSFAILSGAGISTTAAVTFTGAGGLLVLEQSTQIGALNSALTGSKVNIATGDTLTTGTNNGNDTFAGDVTTGALTKVGTGIFTLSDTNSYTGATTVSAGTLNLTGVLGATAMTVASGASITGTGTTGGSVTIQSGGILAPGLPGAGNVGTLTTGALTLNAGANFNVDLSTPGVIGGTPNDLVTVNGAATLGGTVNVNPEAGFGAGAYRLANYTGALTNNGVAVTGVPAGETAVVQASNGQVNLLVGGANGIIQYWNGAATTPNGTVNGGTGSWTNAAANSNWTDATGAFSESWASGTGIFAGAAGTVTVNDTISFQALDFQTTGYTVAAGTGTLTATGVGTITTEPGVTTTIGAQIIGGAITKLGTGTLALTGANTYAGGTTLTAGTLQVGNNTALGTGALTFNGGTLQAGGAFTLANTATINGGITGTIDANGKALTYGGAIGGAGNLTIADSVGGGSVTVTASNAYTGATTVNTGATLAVSGTGAITQSASLTNSGTFTVAVGGSASFSTITNNTGATITNNGTVNAFLTNSGTVTNNGTWTGNVNSIAGSITNNGTWTGDLTGNTALVTNNATWNATNVAVANIINSSGGTLTTGTGSSITATNAITNASDGSVSLQGSIATPSVTNGGTVTVTGTATANGSSYANQSGGTTAVGGNSFTGIGPLTNDGTVSLAGGGTLGVTSFTNNGDGTVTSTGTINSTSFANAGTVNAGGGAINGPITNTNQFNVTGTVSSSTTFNNATGGATLAITGTGAYTLGGLLTNSGTITVAAGGSLTDTSGITNTGTGTISNAGTITDVLTNAGTVTNTGTYNADVNNTGTIGNSGTWNGSLLSNTNLVTNSGTWNAVTFVNNGGGTVTTTNVLNATTSVTNAGTFNAQNQVNTPSFTNSGTLNVTGNLTGIGALSNSGTINNNSTTGTTITVGSLSNSGAINMVNGSPTNSFVVTGAYTGAAGSTLSVDTLFNASAGQRSDVLTAGSTSGSTAVTINAIGPKTYFATPIPVVQVSGASSGTFTVANPSALASAGIVNYAFEKVGSNYDVVATLNPSAASGFATSIAASLAAINVGFFQNSSAFISAPPDPKPNQIGGGPWIRFAGGSNDVTATGSTPNGIGGTSYAHSDVRTNFNGFQTGVDLGVFNIQNSGYNVHLGVTAGEVALNASELSGATNTTQASVPFVGIYGAVTGHGFFADFLVREDLYNLHVTNPTAFLTSAPLNGTALSVNSSVGYKYDVSPQFFVEPSVAVLYSRLHLDSLQVGIDPTTGQYGTLAFAPIDSLLGRAGVRIGTTWVPPNAGIALQPFATGSVWREFASNTSTTFISTGGNVPIAVTRIGTFEQVGLGISGQVLDTGLLGFFRADYRFGEDIHGYALNAGLRYQF